jgi:hypothetical protein
MTVAELQATISAARSSLVEYASRSRADTLRALRELHEALMRVTPGLVDPPAASLDAVATVVAELDPGLIDALSPRPRTVYRLLRARATEAAWAVLLDNATGVVAEPFDASTATGAARTSWRLPLLTRLEPPNVFAELAGFRDPRYAAPDECYDITATIRLKHHLDEVHLDGTTLGFGGWAALDVLTTEPSERVRLILATEQDEIVIDGRRVRRPDLVAGRGEALKRRAWAGWSARVDLADSRLSRGSWALWLDVDHRGVSRREPLGRDVSAEARTATSGVTRAGRRPVRWDVSSPPWRLVVTG